MKTYIQTLRAEVDETKRQREEARAEQARADTRVVCDKPLKDQIEELMLSLPPAQLYRPWSMDEFIARLHGRFRLRPHPMNIGRALRALGWTQKRDWSLNGGGRRVWYPAP